MEAGFEKGRSDGAKKSPMFVLENEVNSEKSRLNIVKPSVGEHELSD